MADPALVCSSSGPRSDVDLWSDEVLADPFPVYAALRDQGSAVWLERHGMVALPRYAEVQAALVDWHTFSSASGVGADSGTNASLPDGLLWSDPPEHSTFRRLIARQLSSHAVEGESERLERIAMRMVEPLLDRSDVEAITDFARPFVATVIGEFLGMPEEDRRPLPELSERAFDVFGPADDRQRAGLSAFGTLVENAADLAERLDADTRGGELVSAGEPMSMVNYTWPGVDTTVQAVGSALYLLARHPDQWALLRDDPSLVASAAEEVLRLHSPVRYFTRRTTTTADLDTVRLPADTRVVIMYGSANRDERRFPEPDRFDITRSRVQHLAFGSGVHHCVGANLARLELHAVLEVLRQQVSRFELREEPAWTRSLSIHGLQRLAVTLHG